LQEDKTFESHKAIELKEYLHFLVKFCNKTPQNSRNESMLEHGKRSKSMEKNHKARHMQPWHCTIREEEEEDEGEEEEENYCLTVLDTC
jgi:hypothetical protein